MTAPPRAPTRAAAPKTAIWRTWLSYGLVLGFALWCVLGFQHDLAQIHLVTVLAAWPVLLWVGGLSLVNYALRAWRWRLYLREAGHPLPARFATLTFMAGFAFTLSPGKIGEMVRARYYRPLGIPLAHITSAFFVERLLDLLAMMLLTLAALTELAQYQAFLWLALVLVAGAMLTLALMPWARLQASMTQHTSPWTHRATRVLAVLVQARSLLAPRILLIGLLLGSLAWSLEAVGLKLLTDALSTHTVSWPSAMGIYAVAIIVGALSFLPGGLGSTEFVMAGLLTARGVPTPEAILLTLVCRLLTLWLAVFIGWLCVWALPKPPTV